MTTSSAKLASATQVSATPRTNPVPGKTDAKGFSGPVSHSALSMFKECPLRFKLERIEKIPTMPQEAPAIGSLAHAVIARYLKHLFDSKQASDLDVHEAFIEEAAAEVPAGMNPGFLRDTLHRFAGGFLFEPEEGDEVFIEEKLALDRKFNPVGFWSKDAFFRGVADLIFLNRKKKRARITDFKSGYSMAHDDEQTNRYGLLVHRHFGVECVDVGFHFVRHAFSTPMTTLGLEDFRAAASRLLIEARALSAERRFRSNPGPWCSTCGYAGTAHCPANLTAVSAIGTLKDAEKAVGEIEKMTGALKRLKCVLETWCSAHGPVQVGKVEWGHHPVVSKHVDAGVLARVIAESNGSAPPDEATRRLLSGVVTLRKSRETSRVLDRYSERLEKLGGCSIETATRFSRVRVDTSVIDTSVPDAGRSDGDDE